MFVEKNYVYLFSATIGKDVMCARKKRRYCNSEVRGNGMMTCHRVERVVKRALAPLFSSGAMRVA